MSQAAPTIPPQRGGTAFRSGASRHFHVMGEGWFLCTREGVQGPFLDRQRANHYLLQLTSEGPESCAYGLAPGQFDAWR